MMQRSLRPSTLLVTVLIVALVLLPLLPQFVWSFAARWFFPDLLPQAWGLDAWRYLLSPSSRMVEALRNSTGLALLVTALSTAIGLPAARALGLHAFRGKAFVEWLILAPILVPPLVVTMGMNILFIRYGLAYTFIGVALIHLVPALPYFVLVMASVFAGYNVDLEATARTLGAPPWRVFVSVTLPAIAPGLSVAALFTFLVSWSQYITTVLIGGGQVVTLPMVLFPFVSSADHANAAAISLVFLAPALLALFLVARTLHSNTAALGGFGRV